MIQVVEIGIPACIKIKFNEMKKAAEKIKDPFKKKKALAKIEDY